MKTGQELITYVNDFMKCHSRMPHVIIAGGVWVKNDIKTKDLHPWKWGKNGSWIDYWRAFANSDNSGNIPTPADLPHSCSNSPFGILNPNGHQDERATDNDCDYDIVGAHVLISPDLGKTWYKEKYIVPLCKACNGKHDEKIQIIAGVKMVEMLDPYEEKVSIHGCAY